MYTFSYKDLATSLYDALLTDPFYIRLLQSVADSHENQQALIKYMDYSIVEAARYGRLFIPQEHKYGVSIWSKPLDADADQLKYQQKKDFLKAELGDATLDAYMQMTAFMGAQTAALIPTHSWYLSIVGIKPRFQGKGLGPALLYPVLDETDKLQVPTYLETFTPRNISFYNRIGYETAATFIEPLTNSPYWILVRPPKSR
jgi:GNAT superfamily N-acetyltransferase